MEWGSGASTRWFSQRVARIVSFEHDEAWLQPESVLVPLDGYAEAVRGRGPFDVAVIDGARRNDCATEVLDELAPRGVVIWDNAERPEYVSGFDALAAAGFRQIDFVGFGPVNGYRWTTSILYRVNNCFGI